MQNEGILQENEAFQQALRTAQRRLLAVTKDRNFLLDRLLMHEKIDHSTSESEETESSDDGEVRQEQLKRRKEMTYSNVHNVNSGKAMPVAKKKRPSAPRPSKSAHPTVQISQHMPHTSANPLTDGHMTPEEVERHLQSQSFLEFVPERAPPTVPTEMFSNEPSLDSESNDIGELETSPSNMGEELSIDMIPE
ncbi:unnamed protein product [Acanthoscelides obtectus]|uniref:INO80 complex subunit E N-terminal domain-containing protein n=1 Tax=Acanthoscelides obtectus TaxID=200917 RepID=A0A9P0P3Q5_ACAOB|nr:unnamed protein product [Acanthoscelides obtectus]CAK1683164.1 INO80 complex subunit E [Acanthoscelides obtectus]